LANTKQAKKRVIQSETRRVQNSAMRSKVRTYIKKVRKAVEAGQTENAVVALREAIPVIDRMAAKGIIHKNNAARNKSRLNARVKALVLGEKAAASA
jgi:small subunit ribosomal protein S20